MTRKVTTAEREEARADLIRDLPPGATVWTVLRHRSASGMSRSIDAYTFGPDFDSDGAPVCRWLSWLVCKATGFAFDQARDSVKAQGTGMDMGFHVVYSLSRALYPDGFGCIGERCPSNDHSNGDRDYTPNRATGPLVAGSSQQGQSHWHRDGGYALRHRWIG